MSRFAHLLEQLQSCAPQPGIERDGLSYTYGELLEALEH
jgi:hypothetical protein